MSDDFVNDGVNSDSNSGQNGSGIKSVMRPGVVRVIGKVAQKAGRPVMQAGRLVRPVGVRPLSQPVFNRPVVREDFNGVVDDRILPDAGLPTEFVEGFLDVTPDGHGYLRPKMIPSSKDVYISASQVRRFGLRPGDMVGGQAREPKENERFWWLLKVEKINGVTPEEAAGRPDYDSLTAVFPNEQVVLETDSEILST